MSDPCLPAGTRVCVVCHRPVPLADGGTAAVHDHPPQGCRRCPGVGLEPVVLAPPAVRVRMGTWCPRGDGGHMVWRDDVDPHSCDGKGWPVIVEADVADAGLLPKWAGRHSPGPGDGAATVVAELVGDLADSPEPPASLVRAARFLGIPDTPPSRCCDRVYFCFVAIDFECDQHAGFSVCCDRPQWHRRGPYTPGP